MAGGIENEYGKYWVREGILFIVSKPIAFLDIGIAKVMTADRIRLQEDEAFPVFCDSRGVNDSSKEARDFFAHEGSVLIKAVAIFDDRIFRRTALRYYLMRNKPLVPTAFFDRWEEGVGFLEI